MTEISKPGGHGEVACVPLVSQLKLQTVVINTLLIFYAYFCYPQQLENLSGHAQSIQQARNKIYNKAGGGGGVKNKIEFRI